MAEFLQLNTVGLYFLYGLSFYTMGIAAALKYRSHSRFRLAYSLNLLAAFGLLHGLSEWGSVFIPVKIPCLDPTWKVVALQRILQSVSLFFLFCFGMKLISDSRNRNYVWFALPVCAFGAWLAHFVLFIPRLGTAELSHWLMHSENWARYLLAFPAGIFTAYGLFLQFPEARKMQDPTVRRDLWGAVAAFFLFALFSGLVVTHGDGRFAQTLNANTFRETIGLPIEVFRTTAALLATWFITSLLTEIHLVEQREVEETRHWEAVYRERERFARDLHDDVIQSIYGVGLELKAAIHMLEHDPVSAVNKVKWSIASLDKVIQALRAYIRNLAADDPEQDLKTILRKAIEDLGEQSQLDIQLNFLIDHEPRLSQTLKNAEWKHHIRQIVREALSNVIHHACATQVVVSVATSGNRLIVTIEDNGRGFAPPRAANGAAKMFAPRTIKLAEGLGLKNMKARAHMLEGSLQITSNSGQGTKVELSVPLA